LIHNIPSRTGVNISFTTLKKLIKTQSNIIGLIESSTDLNLIGLLKKDFPNFIVYLSEDKLIYEAIEKKIDGIVSSISISFGKIIKEIMEDYQIGFKNELIVSYLKLVCEIFSEYNIPSNVKYYLSKKGYKSMNLRLPLVKVKDINEDFNLLM
jgi:4-hydroxy-tetrahydrodipicolinate synthase